MKKYSKASYAALVGAVATLVEFFTDVDVPAVVQGAVVTIVVFFAPSNEE